MSKQESHSNLILEEMKQDPNIASFLGKDYIRKKLIKWGIRTTILLVLYIIFWESKPFRNTIYFTIPLSVLSGAMVFLMPYFIRKKIAKVTNKIENLEVSTPTLSLEDYMDNFKDMKQDVENFTDIAYKHNHQELLALSKEFQHEYQQAIQVENTVDAETYYNELMSYIREMDDIIEDESLDQEDEFNLHH